MQTYETEEQQVEALKQWWKANGRSVIGGLVIGIAAIVGWKAWGNHQQRHATDASQLYDQFSGFLRSKDDASKSVERAQSIGSQLVNDYGDTSYAAMADLALAKISIEKGETDDALQRLQRVAKENGELALNSLARIRLARLYIAIGKPENALQQLKGDIPDGFKNMALELRGDALLASGKPSEAASAYDEALAQMKQATTQRNLIQMKRDDLGA